MYIAIAIGILVTFILWNTIRVFLYSRQVALIYCLNYLIAETLYILKNDYLKVQGHTDYVYNKIIDHLRTVEEEYSLTNKSHTKERYHILKNALMVYFLPPSFLLEIFNDMEDIGQIDENLMNVLIGKRLHFEKIIEELD
jgi:hypothetical protein